MGAITKMMKRQEWKTTEVNNKREKQEICTVDIIPSDWKLEVIIKKTSADEFSFVIFASRGYFVKTRLPLEDKNNISMQNRPN